MSRRSLSLLGIGLILGALVGALILWGLPAGWLQVGEAASAEAFNAFEGLESAPRVGARAPNFSLMSVSGAEVRLSDLRGQPVMLNFWATWCGPCRIEMPTIQEHYELHHPELVVLAVNFDEPAAEVAAFADELSLTFPVLLDPGGEVNGSLYQVRGYPSSIFIDADGIIQAVHIGMLTDGQLVDYLAEIGVEP